MVSNGFSKFIKKVEKKAGPTPKPVNYKLVWDPTYTSGQRVWYDDYPTDTTYTNWSTTSINGW